MCTQAANAQADELTASYVHERRNHRLGVAAGMIGNVAREFLQPELILVGLIYAVTRSTYLAALVVIINKAGMLGPQLAVGRFVEHLPRRRPSFMFVTAARAVTLTALVFSLWMLTQGAGALSLSVFYLSYLLVCVFGGAGHVVFMDMVGRFIPNGRVASFLGTRQFLGGAAAILAGYLIIQPILGQIETPRNYLLLGFIGAVLVVLDMFLFCFCREEDGPKAPGPTKLRESLRRGFHWLRADKNYRLYLTLRVAFRINYLGLAFFIPYGVEMVRRTGSAVDVVLLGGVLTGTFRLSRVIASRVFGRLADRKGFRFCLVTAGAFYMLAPILALGASVLPRAFVLMIPGTGVWLDLPLTVYLLALTVIGMAIQSNMLGGRRFVITAAPPHRRVSYLAFPNTLTSPLTLLILAGAWLSETLGVRTLFMLLVAGGLFHLLTALRMEDEKLEAPAASETGD